MRTIPTPPNNGTLCQVSREHILSIRTARGAWTRKQLLALGVSWPPQHGWLEEWEPRMIPLSDWDTATEDAGIVVGLDEGQDFTVEGGSGKNRCRARRAQFLASKVEVSDMLGMGDAMARWDV